MSPDQDPKPKKTAMVAIFSAIFVAFILVGLGYAAYVNSDINQDIVKPEVSDDLSDIANDDSLPPLTKPVDGKEIQDKIDELSDDLENESNSKKLNDEVISDEQLGL